MNQVPSFKYEVEKLQIGYQFIAGIDEVGRGAWAGPVVAAAVILPHRLYRLRDSKILSRSKREILARKIRRLAINFGIGIAEVWEINELGLHQATFLAYERAITQIKNIDFLLIDGFQWPKSPLPHQAIIKGDNKCSSIAAASIIAKVERDKMMRQLHRLCRQYRFDLHKGYGTKLHQQRLIKHGPSEHHRQNYRPIKKLLSTKKSQAADKPGSV